MLAIIRRITRRTGKREGGQSLVEFALVLPIFLLVLFAIVDFGMAFHAWITVTNSAREGARLGAVRADSTDIEQRVRDTADSLDQGDLLVTVTNAEGVPGESVVVDVSYGYSLMTPLAGIVSMMSGGNISDSLTLSSTADMRLE
jgi:Flp pilus assembly protein TadG